MNTVRLKQTQPIEGSVLDMDKNILEALPVAVLLVGQEGAVSYANSQAKELLGTSVEALSKIDLLGVAPSHFNLLSLVDLGVYLLKFVFDVIFTVIAASI